MTKPVEKTIAGIRQLSEPEKLDERTRAAIEEGISQADRGELVSDEEMAEFFRRRGA
jgi:predicted transcriptional regulator